MKLGVTLLLREGFRRTRQDIPYLMILALPMAGLEVSAQYLPSSFPLTALVVFALMLCSFWIDAAINWGVHESLMGRGGIALLGSYVAILKRAPELLLVWLNIIVGLVFRVLLLVVPSIRFWCRSYLAPLIVLFSTEKNAHLAVSESSQRMSGHGWLVFRWLIVWVIIGLVPDFLGGGVLFVFLTVLFTLLSVICGALISVLLYLKTENLAEPTHGSS